MAPKRLSSKKEEQGYQIVYDDLKGSGMQNAEQAEDRIANMVADGKRYTVIAAAILIVLLLLLPRYAVFFVLIFLIFMAWAWTSIMAGKRYIRRYVEEELSSSDPTGTEADND